MFRKVPVNIVEHNVLRALGLTDEVVVIPWSCPNGGGKFVCVTLNEEV